MITSIEKFKLNENDSNIILENKIKKLEKIVMELISVSNMSFDKQNKILNYLTNDSI